MGEPMNLARSVTGGAIAGNQLLQLSEDRKNAPMLREAAQMQMESGKIKLSKEKAIEQLRNAAIDGSYIRRDLASGDLNTAISRMEQRNRRIMESGGDNQHTQQWLSALSSRDPAQIEAVAAEMAEIERAYQTYGGGSGGGLSAAEREFEAMTAGMSPQDKEKARRITLGLDPRAMGSSSITIAQHGLTDPVAASQGVIAGSVAGAQQGQKAAYADDIAANTAIGAQAAESGAMGGPSAADIAGQIAQAKEEAKREGEIATTQRLNAVALDVYNTGMTGLKNALAGTTTGPVVGRMPAVTANQQIAEGAIASVAPVLKQMFRSAGEGVFTDKDQQLLIEMIPKRTDHPEARAAKMAGIDAIVNAKLGGAGNDADPLGLR
jgi:hypothetical protein